MARSRTRAGDVATSERLLDAAELEFARAGYAAARLEDVAARVGIRRPSLLHHYPAKQELYAAVVQRSFSSLGRALLGQIGAAGPFEARLEGLVRAFTRFVDRRPALARVILREVLDGRGPGRDLLMTQVSPLLDRVERFLRREGRARLRPGLPVRAALVQTCADVLLRAASGDLRTTLWGARDQAWTLARSRFLAGPGAAARRPS